jgi:hypothetical protein
METTLLSERDGVDTLLGSGTDHRRLSSTARYEDALPHSDAVMSHSYPHGSETVSVIGAITATPNYPRPCSIVVRYQGVSTFLRIRLKYGENQKCVEKSTQTHISPDLLIPCQNCKSCMGLTSREMKEVRCARPNFARHGSSHIHKENLSQEKSRGTILRFHLKENRVLCLTRSLHEGFTKSVFTIIAQFFL